MKLGLARILTKEKELILLLLVEGDLVDRLEAIVSSSVISNTLKSL